MFDLFDCIDAALVGHDPAGYSGPLDEAPFAAAEADSSFWPGDYPVGFGPDLTDASFEPDPAVSEMDGAAAAHEGAHAASGSSDFELFSELHEPAEHHDDLGAVRFGTPEADSSHWHLQEGDNSCAVASQSLVLESLLDRPVSEAELARIAEERGWYDPVSGTPVEHVGDLLEACGVPVVRSPHTTLPELADALDRGEKVIVAVNANEIWEPRVDFWGNLVEQPVAGHAVWVTGIEIQDDGRCEVVLNDTGTPDGRQKHVPVEVFAQAWDDFGGFATMTNLHSEAIHA